MKIKCVILLYIILSGITASGQDSLSFKMGQVQLLPEDTITQFRLNGQVVSAIIENGDTTIIADIEDVSISSPRKFANQDEYLKYLKYRRYAAKVYPYAKEAIRIFREAEYVTNTMSKRKSKKYLKRLSKELGQEFETPLKRLSKTQGKILVKMIERELDTPMFHLIAGTKGKFKAFYWNQSSKLYGYRLKEGYQKGQNPILDVVLQDFDISHEVVQNK
jgi:hypothetical protein